MQYLTMEELVDRIGEPTRSAIRRMIDDHAALLRSAPGSRSAHQAWPGGWWDHVVEVMNIAIDLHDAFDTLRALPFTVSDALLVLWLHDLEKPWKHGGDEATRVRLQDKATHMDFRLALMADYGVDLTAEQMNGLRYVEGEGDDYVPGARVMSPLAAFCHMCDIASARIWHDRPREENETWGKRITLE